MRTLKEIDDLRTQLFSGSWTDLHATGALATPELKFPGVYLLAYTDDPIEDKRVNARDVFYVGMSNAAGGVGQRLKQFKRGIENCGRHSGAMRFYRDYGHNRPYSKSKSKRRFYFAALTLPFVSDKAAARPIDLKSMGHVACLEYYAIAYVASRTGRRPALNKLGTPDNGGVN